MMWEEVLCPGSPVDSALGSPPVPLPLWNRPPLLGVLWMPGLLRSRGLSPPSVPGQEEAEREGAR